MEIEQNNGLTSRALQPSNTFKGLTKIHVDSAAASALADGSAQNPYRTVEAALRLCPQELIVTPEGLMEMHSIDIAGVFENVVLDRPVVLIGKGGLYNLSAETGNLVYLNGVLLVTATFGGDANQNVILDAILDNGSSGLTLNDLAYCTIQNTQLYGNIAFGAGTAGTIIAVNSVFTQALVIPTDWTINAYNCYFADLSGAGTINLYNSQNDHA